MAKRRRGHSVLSVYSGFLGETQHVAQGQRLLQDYLAGNPDRDPQQKAAILYSLASLASQAGDSRGLEEYQRLAHGLQAQTDSLPAGEIRLVGDVQKAQAFVNQQHYDGCLLPWRSMFGYGSAGRRP